jgi:integrase
LNELARTGRTNELQVDDPTKEQALLEQRFGSLADAVLSRHHLRISAASRIKLIGLLYNSLNEAAKINEAKALGDYSDSGETNKYPAFEIAAPTEEPVGRARLTFAEVIDKEVKRRASGRGGSPLRERSEKKYRQAVAEFDVARGDDDVLSINAKQADHWLNDMLDAGKLKIKTDRDRFKNVKTVIEWAREQGLGEVFPDRNPLDVVKPPKAEATDSAARTIRLDEAMIILKAARNESKPERRWLPWMCAYSGARIGEVAQLGPDDFFCVGDDWFYRLTSEDDKLIKGGYSIRRVPVHPALIDEGLLQFVEEGRKGGSNRLFPNRSQGNIRDWVRNELGLTRRELAPNHGWRHLFEDMALIAHMTDAAKLYITGRSRGSSAEGYGKSDAMLPGLAAQMRRIETYL